MRKKSGDKIREKIRRPKDQNPRNIRSAKNRPRRIWRLITQMRFLVATILPCRVTLSVDKLYAPPPPPAPPPFLARAFSGEGVWAECTKIAHRHSLISDFYRRRRHRRKFCSEDHFYPFSSQKKSQFASDFLRRGNRASWGLKKSRDFLGSGKNRRRNRRESRDFGSLRGWGVYFEAPVARVLCPPPSFEHPPTPRRIFSGVGGGGLLNKF